MVSAPVDHFAEVDRAAIAQLAGPVAKLVAPVAHGVGVHPRQLLVARKDLAERCAGDTFRRQIE